MTDAQRLALLRSARAELRKTKEGYNKLGGHWRLADERLDKLEADLRAVPKPRWMQIGPVVKGGISLLDESLTHATSGIPLFPAFDTAWGGGGGVICIAPESCVVDTKDTSSSPGEAIFVTGVSKIRYWVGHLDRDWQLGHRFKKGDVIGRTLPIPGQSDHAHWGVNVEALLGKGKQLKYGETGRGPNYTRGSPTIRAQLLRLEV
jgi:hypothetical protein